MGVTPETSKFWGILGNRCPRCRVGAVFSGVYAMNVRCPSCDLKFERESGYFLGAMVISYFVGAFSLIPTAVLLVFGLHAGLEGVIGVLLAQILLLSPILFRYSRISWLYIDQNASPGDQP